MIEDNTTPIKSLVDKDSKPISEPIADIHISQRKDFRIDGDNNRVLSLDITDLNVITRLNEAYPNMKQAAISASEKLASIKDTDDEDSDILAEMAEALKDIDADMRKQIDFVFDAPVSAVCVPKGTMYDPYQGGFRFEHIIDVLTNLYANNVSTEYKNMRERVNKKTAKYTKRKK